MNGENISVVVNIFIVAVVIVMTTVNFLISSSTKKIKQKVEEVNAEAGKRLEEARTLQEQIARSSKIQAILHKAARKRKDI